MASAATEAFTEEHEAQAAALAVAEATLVAVETRTELVEEPPPPPYTTADLLEEAIERLEWTGDRVMQIAQTLFEGVEVDQVLTGLITYHRTDSIRAEPEARLEARAVIQRLYSAEALPPLPPELANWVPAKRPVPRVILRRRPNWWERLMRWLGLARLTYRPRPAAATASLGAGSRPQLESEEAGAHECIRPTVATRLPDSLIEKLTEDELKLYRLIWERFIASEMKPSVWRVTAVEFESDAEEPAEQGGAMPEVAEPFSL